MLPKCQSGLGWVFINIKLRRKRQIILANLHIGKDTIKRFYSRTSLLHHFTSCAQSTDKTSNQPVNHASITHYWLLMKWCEVGNNECYLREQRGGGLICPLWQITDHRTQVCNRLCVEVNTGCTGCHHLSFGVVSQSQKGKQRIVIFAHFLYSRAPPPPPLPHHFKMISHLLRRPLFIICLVFPRNNCETNPLNSPRYSHWRRPDRVKSSFICRLILWPNPQLSEQSCTDLDWLGWECQMAGLHITANNAGYCLTLLFEKETNMKESERQKQTNTN